LIVGAGIAYARNRQLGVLDAIVFGTTFSKSASIHANHRRVALQQSKSKRECKGTQNQGGSFLDLFSIDTYKVGVNSIKSRSVRNCHVNLVAPCHGFANLHLLILGWIPALRENT
jgi:hypothetical protein